MNFVIKLKTGDTKFNFVTKGNSLIPQWFQFQISEVQTFWKSTLLISQLLSIRDCLAGGKFGVNGNSESWSNKLGDKKVNSGEKKENAENLVRWSSFSVF